MFVGNYMCDDCYFDGPPTKKKMNSKPTKLWFSYDKEGGFLLHETAEIAKKSAEESLESYREIAPDEGWFEDVEHIYWGEVKQKVEIKELLQRPPKEELDDDCYDSEGRYWGEWNQIVDYQLIDL